MVLVSLFDRYQFKGSVKWKKRGVVSGISRSALYSSTFPQFFYFFLKDPGPLKSIKRIWAAKQLFMCSDRICKITLKVRLLSSFIWDYGLRKPVFRGKNLPKYNYYKNPRKLKKINKCFQRVIFDVFSRYWSWSLIMKIMNAIAGEHIPESQKFSNVYSRYWLNCG